MKMIKNKKKKDVMITWKKMKGAFVNEIKKNLQIFERVYNRAASKLREKSSIVIDSLSNGRLPLMHIKADFKIRNESLHLIKESTFSYLSSVLDAIFVAIYL